MGILEKHSGAEASAFIDSSKPLKIRRLLLQNFRSYGSLDLSLEANRVVLWGLNGAGKTNVLEALSLLSPGKGLRRAESAEYLHRPVSGRQSCAQNLPSPSPQSPSASLEVVNSRWAASIHIWDGYDYVPLGIGGEIDQNNKSSARLYRLAGTSVPSANHFAEYIRVLWLTPAMDSLFLGAASERRRFLDRLVLSLDITHGARVAALERALRNRNRLLENAYADKGWLDAIEHEIAELGICVAAARQEAVRKLTHLIETEKELFAPFPWAVLKLESAVDELVLEHPAIEAEERYRTLLRANRSRDAQAKRTLIGPHIAELLVSHGPKNTLAALSSTGEQKALLVGLILAHAQLVKMLQGKEPLILLDEIAAHFDSVRRQALYDHLIHMNTPVWLTGADKENFSGLKNSAQFCHVIDGTIVPG